VTESVLQVIGLAKAFGGIRAVDDVSFAIAAGDLVALIGPNGAGKTTCFNLVNGQLVPDAGSVKLAGMRIDGLQAHEIARRGVGRTFQVAATFASMTVRENVAVALLAHARQEDRIATLASARGDADVDALLERVACADLAEAHCAALSYGNAKRVELALALASRPRLLLMDEPTAGMATRSRARLMHVAADLAKRDGIAVLFTEHDMDVVFAFADRVIVLDHGKIIADGPPEAVRADPRVRAVYLGEDESV
jgi:branched-chain amino acid transport system ATP-binding protein